MVMHSPPHPGEILKELYLILLGLTVTAVAKGLSVARKTLSELANGRAGVSAEMAFKLSKAFQTTPESWLNLQQQHDLWNSRKKVSTLEVKEFSWSTQEKEDRI